MLQNIANLEGAHELSKQEQKTINGGVFLECYVAGEYCGYMSMRDCRDRLTAGTC